MAHPGLPPTLSHTLSSGDILKRVIFHPVGFYRRLLLEAFQKEVNISEVDTIFLPDTSSSVNSFASKHKAQMLKIQPIPYLPDISIRIRKTWVQILPLSLTDWVILNSLTFSKVCFLYLYMTHLGELLCILKQIKWKSSWFIAWYSVGTQKL